MHNRNSNVYPYLWCNLRQIISLLGEHRVFAEATNHDQSKVPHFIIGAFYCGEYICIARLSSTKLSNLLKSQSSSVSADETRPPLGSDDRTGLQKSRSTRFINNADHQTSRALAWCEKTCISVIIINVDVEFAFTADEVDTVLCLIFHVRAFFFIFHHLSSQHACD